MTAQKEVQMKRRMIFTCPICGSPVDKTRHHVLPKRKFRISPIFEMCKVCHEDMEMEIARLEKLACGDLNAMAYFNIWIIYVTTHCKRGITWTKGGYLQ